MKNTLNLTNTPRRLIVFAGPQNWGVQSAQTLISSSKLCHDEATWLSDKTHTAKLLGQDRSLVVIDAYSGLDPDSVGQASGAIIAGGALILICPSFEKWPCYPDPENKKITPYPLSPGEMPSLFLRRWAHYLAATEGIECYTPDSFKTPPPVLPEQNTWSASAQATPDQQKAITAVIKLATGKRKQSLLITASRGRGKSAVLGMAAATLFQTLGAQKIAVTSAGFANARHVFTHARRLLDDADYNEQKKSIVHQQSELQYYAPDFLIAQKVPCDLLLVDEAAAMGIHRLAALLKHYSRIVFVSTEHGYEGSGRGFSLKFKQLLQKHHRGTVEIKMDTPIRWGKNDPLERWTEELLLLDQCVSEIHHPVPSLEALRFNPLKRAELLHDEPLLRRVFRHLLEAHYQTRPSDLRLLLDAPNTRLWMAESDGRIAGLIWVMLEGELRPEIAHEIIVGRRRPQGHLAPQILAAHLAIPEAVTLKSARIVRIVVRPQWQNNGIGRWMLSQLEHTLRHEIDYFSSSYGVNMSLSRFWQQAAYSTVRISDTTNVASGLHSALVLKAISESGAAVCKLAQGIFHSQLIEQLADPLSNYSPERVCTLVSDTGQTSAFSQNELEAGILFSFGQRPFESTLAAMKKIAESALFEYASHPELSDTARYLLIMRCLQKQPWASCSAQLNLSGKSHCLALLKNAAETILSGLYTNEQIQALRLRFKLV